MSTLDARDNLNHIAHHWPDLQHALGGLHSTPTDKITVQTSGDPQAPINLHVLDLHEEITNWAVWAVNQLKEHAGIARPPAVGTAIALRHLAKHHECWDGIDDFEHAAARYRRKTDRALRNHTRTYLGPCPSKGEDNAGCTGSIYATNNAKTGTCPVCGTPWRNETQNDYVRTELDNVLMTPTELAQALLVLGHNIKRRSIYDWIERGKIKPQEPGLYKLDDAINLAAKAT